MRLNPAGLAAMVTPAAATQAEALQARSAINPAFVRGFRPVMLVSAGLAPGSFFCAWQLISKQTTRHAVPG